MGKEIEFAGHIISDTGIRTDEKKFEFIKLLGMSKAKRTSCIKSVHMCPGGGEKAERLSRLSLPRLSVILFVCSCSS